MSVLDKSRNSRHIHLVNDSDRRASHHDSDRNEPDRNNRIEIGDYLADILVDNRSFPIVVHWIVQRRGNPEILQWGHTDDFETASHEAIEWMKSLLQYDEYRSNRR